MKFSLLCGCVVSFFLSVMVASAQSGPTITGQPQSVYAYVGDSPTFTVTATAASTITYQWQFNNQNIAGANTSTLSIANVQTYQGGSYQAIVTAGGISVSSVIAQLTILTPPVFSGQPSSATVVSGNSIYLYVYANGSSPMSYQWKLNGVTIPGATGNYYSPTASSATAGTYTVDATNPAGSATSDPAVITVVDAIAFTASPAGAVLDKGGSTTLSVTATGPGTLLYQWYKDGNPIFGATSLSYTISNASASDSGSYVVQVSNQYQTYGVQSNGAVVSVKAPPVFTTQLPATVTATANLNCSLNVSVGGAAPITYQWQKNGVALANSGSNYYTNPGSLYFYSTSTNDAGSYTVVASNAYGSVTSSACTVSVAANPNAPSITTQPASVTATIGSTASFSVVATNPLSGVLNYQWMKDGTAISGATSPSYTILAVTNADAGNYSVSVTNYYSSSTSGSATLTVAAASSAPVITQQPASLSVLAGTPASFSVSATGSPAPTYQWQKNGVAISGATGASYTINTAQAVDRGDYTVVVANTVGSVTSNTATLSLIPQNRLVNLSSRAQVGTDANIMIAGFVIGGSSPKQVLIRAVGPTLANFQVLGALANPMLKLFDVTGKMIANNDDWGVSANLVDLTAAMPAAGAFALPSGSRDAALLVTLDPGAYTAQVAGAASTTGVALVEVYEMDSTSPARLINISTRALVGTGADVLIGGLVITGNSPKTVLVRAVGPTLAQYGVTGVLANPQLQIINSVGLTLGTNDDWSSGASAATVKAATVSAGAFAFPDGSKDAALVITLDPGAYTVVVSGTNNTSGIALVEVYEMP